MWITIHCVGSHFPVAFILTAESQHTDLFRWHQILFLDHIDLNTLCIGISLRTILRRTISLLQFLGEKLSGLPWFMGRLGMVNHLLQHIWKLCRHISGLADVLR